MASSSAVDAGDGLGRAVELLRAALDEGEQVAVVAGEVRVAGPLPGPLERARAAPARRWRTSGPPGSVNVHSVASSLDSQDSATLPLSSGLSRIGEVDVGQAVVERALMTWELVERRVQRPGRCARRSPWRRCRSRRARRPADLVDPALGGIGRPGVVAAGSSSSPPHAAAIERQATSTASDGLTVAARHRTLEPLLGRVVGRRSAATATQGEDRRGERERSRRRRP